MQGSELEHAVGLANRKLNEPGADPDDDYAVLSRQLLRLVEKNKHLEELVGIAKLNGLLIDLKNARPQRSK